MALYKRKYNTGESGAADSKISSGNTQKRGQTDAKAGGKKPGKAADTRRKQKPVPRNQNKSEQTAAMEKKGFFSKLLKIFKKK
jgi:hypothetical protein